MWILECIFTTLYGELHQTACESKQQPCSLQSLNLHETDNRCPFTRQCECQVIQTLPGFVLSHRVRLNECTVRRDLQFIESLTIYRGRHIFLSYRYFKTLSVGLTGNTLKIINQPNLYYPISFILPQGT